MGKKIRLSSVQTLVGMAKRGQAGRFWYDHAHAEIAAGAELLSVPIERFASILAITSPRVSVARNIRLAIHYIRTKRPHSTIMRGIRTGLSHYERTGEIKGPKTLPFSKAIIGQKDQIVLDVWMARAFRIDQSRLSNKTVHAECCKRIKRVASILGWEPAEVQAAIWYHTVRLSGNKPGRFTIVNKTLFGLELVKSA